MRESEFGKIGRDDSAAPRTTPILQGQYIVVSLRFGFETSRDLFAKLKRDVALLEEEVTRDRFFNFVVTACHLAEWIRKDPAFPSSQRKGLSQLEKNRLFRACCDIATASKHYQLRAKRAARAEVDEVSSQQGYGLGRYGIGDYGVGEEEIKISLSSVEQMEAREFARQIIELFDPLFSAV